MRATSVRIESSGSRACYVPSLDMIRMPDRKAFNGTPTSSPRRPITPLCSTSWRTLDRTRASLRPRHVRSFSSEAYAIEELVAELGAAFLCADIGISSAPRADHADNIASWLKCLKADSRTIFKAAAQASKAAAFILGNPALV